MHSYDGSKQDVACRPATVAASLEILLANKAWATKLNIMSTVDEVETAIAKMSPDELRQIAEWLENFLEERLKVRPEFGEGIRRGQQDIASGRVEIIAP